MSKLYKRNSLEPELTMLNFGVDDKNVKLGSSTYFLAKSIYGMK